MEALRRGRAGGRRARFHGSGAAGAAGPRSSGVSTLRGGAERSSSSAPRASGALPASPSALWVVRTARRGRAGAAPWTGIRGPGRAGRPGIPAHQLLLGRAQLRHRLLDLVDSERRAARGGGLGGVAWPRGLRPLWLRCGGVWVTASWPPGSALPLRPGRPNVCEEEELMVVRLECPCVQAFIHLVKLWKSVCTGSRLCAG
ncbi:uncharacterized protein RHO17_019113 [Thomomys bottae]